MGKNSDIINHLIEIKEKVGGIEQHLEDMNGSLNRHDSEIKDNRKSITSVRNRQFYLMGFGAAIVSLSGIIFALIKFKIGV